MAADLLVRGAVALATRARISPTIVAATVVALGTSLPELVVSLRAILTSHPELVLGNVIGSNTANVLIVVGVAALVCPLSPPNDPALRRDAFSMVGVSLVFVLMCVLAGLNRLDGGLLLSGFVMVWGVAAYDSVTERRSRRDADEPIRWVLGLPRKLPMIGLFIVLGVIGLPLGARLVVDAAVEISAQLGVTEAVVGLTVIAFSTSLPELATTATAAFQRRPEVAVAGVTGSNILNLVGIMGISATISDSPIMVPRSILTIDLPTMVGSTLLLALFIWLRKPIGRVTGAIWVIAYFTYIAAQFLVR